MYNNLTLDDWQKEFLETKGDKILCCGRQVGKSVICGMDAGEWAVNNGDSNVLMIAPTERQAYGLFDKTLGYLSEKYPKEFHIRGQYRPTKTLINLKNGTRIYCLPTGINGLSVRFLTVHRLYEDEASRIPDPVQDAVSPALLMTGGDTIYLSTPAGKQGEFYDCWSNKDKAFNSFTRFYQTSEQVIRERKICDTWTELQRDKALIRLVQERAKKSALVYAQEYEGKFLEELRQFFSDDLIRSVMRPKEEFPSLPSLGTNSLGVDVGGMGDPNVLFSLQYTQRKHLYEIDKQITNHQRTTTTVDDCLIADNKWKYKKIYIDDGGKGVAVFDPLLRHSQTKRKVIAINNASRSIDKDGRRKKLLKEDLYNNLLVLMENNKITLTNCEKTFLSLKSVQAEEVGDRLNIFGRDTHIAEALIRAAWITKTKGLKLWCAWS